MENKIKEMARMTIDFATDEEPSVYCILKYKSGSKIKLEGVKDYEKAKHLLTYLFENKLTEGDIESDKPPVYLPNIFGSENEELISAKDINSLFPDQAEDDLSGVTLITNEEINTLFE